MASRGGARLAFVAKPLKGKVTRTVCKYVKGEGIVQEEVPVEAGYMVYCPRGHALRLTKKKLKHYRLDREPPIINMQGLHDPNSPIGKMMTSQDATVRAKGYIDMEQAVMRLATAKTGPVLTPEQVTRTRRSETELQGAE